MEAFEKKYPNFYFVDINNKGRHKLAGTDFDDMDHLNKQGGKKLTLMLDGLIKKFDSEKKRTKSTAGLSDLVKSVDSREKSGSSQRVVLK
jgi:hypothetical protein